MKKLFTLGLVLFAFSAKAQFDFQNITLLANWFDPAVQPEPVYQIKYSGIWGWADGTGNEYAIIGSSDGYYFVNVTNPAAPVVSDYVAGTHTLCIWREIKTYSHYAYLISDDGPANTFQIVDLQYLPDSVHVVHNSNTIFARAHTLYIDGNKMYCASVKGGSQFGTNTSMAVFSLANPEVPVLLRKLSDDFTLPTSPAHDMYVRNDTVFVSAGYDGLFIFRYDEGTNHFVYLGSITAYPAQGYNHSSALTDDGHTLVFADEVPDGLPCKTADVSDFNNLSVNTTFSSNVGATPHNPFIVGKTCYIAYYQDGLQVFDVSNVNSPFRVGYFDTYYQNPAGSYLNPPYQGAWGAYPYLPSGNCLVSDMQNGLFVLDVSAVQSVKSVAAAAFDIYPNPVTAGSDLQFSFRGMENSGTFVLNDISGRTIAEETISSVNGGKFPLPSAETGLYTLTFRNKAGSSFSKKIVITSKN